MTNTFAVLEEYMMQIPAHVYKAITTAVAADCNTAYEKGIDDAVACLQWYKQEQKEGKKTLTDN